MSSMKIIDRKFSGALPVDFYALRLANLPTFKVDNVALNIQQLEKMLRDIPTRTEYCRFEQSASCLYSQ